METKRFATHDLLKEGFAGPFPLALERGEIDEIALYLDRLLDAKQIHPIYGRYATRDWHLVNPAIARLLAHPRIVDELVPLLGEDILLWRSKVFAKAPGEGPLGWHQEWGAFNGEEIGNDRPALVPSSTGTDIWNLTVWIALDDVTSDMGPLRFARGTNRRRFPIRMMPIEHSEFYVDPFLTLSSVAEVVRAARNNRLVLDIDTSGYFDGIDIAGLSLGRARGIVLEQLGREKGAMTLDFDEKAHEIVSLPMQAGSFVVFSERVMHGSSANMSERRRLAINARYTRGDTIIYPYHAGAAPIDGSNLDISRHWSIPVKGTRFNAANEIRSPETEDCLSPLERRACGRGN
jgi:non-heme Fe2+,alpha-ketoglutarate-dependent halogenase